MTKLLSVIIIIVIIKYCIVIYHTSYLSYYVPKFRHAKPKFRHKLSHFVCFYQFSKYALKIFYEMV